MTSVCSTASSVTLPNSHSPRLISFTIDEEEELRTLVSMGVAGIQTNRPDVLRKIADEMGIQLA